MLRKSLDTGISVGAPFQSRGTWYAGRGFDRRALVVGLLSAMDSIRGTLREGSFTGEPER